MECGVAFLLSHDLARADYPATGKVSPAWFRLGFPFSYWSDVLETLGILVALGHAEDARLARAFGWLLRKQDAQGRCKLEHGLNGKLWTGFETQGKASKWIRLRALRVVKAIG